MEALQVPQQLARLPQATLRWDRLSAIEQWSLEDGARCFASGAGRHGQPLP